MDNSLAKSLQTQVEKILEEMDEQVLTEKILKLVTVSTLAARQSYYLATDKQTLSSTRPLPVEAAMSVAEHSFLLAWEMEMGLGGDPEEL